MYTMSKLPHKSEESGVADGTGETRVSNRRSQNGVASFGPDSDDNDKHAPKRERRNQSERTQQPTSPWVYAALVLFAAITYLTMPQPLQPVHGEEPSIQHVFYYGWLTAISTGLGAIPLVFTPGLADYWVGISNGTFFALACSLDWLGRWNETHENEDGNKLTWHALDG